MMVIYAGSSKPYMPEPKVRGLDKLEHLAEYAVLGALALWAFMRTYRKVGAAHAVLASAVISAVYGAMDELHQRFVAGRSCSLTDWSADVIGALIGAAILGIIYVVRKRRGEKEV